MDVRIELSVTPSPEPEERAERHAHGHPAGSDDARTPGPGLVGAAAPAGKGKGKDTVAAHHQEAQDVDMQDGLDEDRARTPLDSAVLPSAATRGGGSRATTPGTVTTADEGVVHSYSSARKRKQAEEEPELPARAARAARTRRSQPQLAEYDRTVTPPPGKPKTTTNSLHIFAPPPPSDRLPLALQHVTAAPPAPAPAAPADNEPTSATPMSVSETDMATDVDSMRKEAAAGYESRLRARTARSSAREAGTRVAVGVVGVSASGRDVRIGTSQRLHAQAIKKKGKGKAEVEVPNQDFCSACKGIGRFLCCDGCPRSFHFACLEPPLRLDELPAEETWLCKKCRAERAREEGVRPPKEKDLGAIPAVFKALSKQIDDENPSQFRLPLDLRRYFVGVSTNTEGEYVDSKDLRTKVDRKGFLEDRDPFRLRDGKHNLIECHVCGGSALPKHSTISDPEATWRQIVSCDYCPLSWHLDCMTPPMTIMPSAGRKWMCPNHAEHVMPKRRTVQDNGKVFDVTAPGKRNNGVIEIPSESESGSGSESESSEIEYEDMIINRKTFRVPEKVIKLDFWEKLRKNKEAASALHKVEEVEADGGGQRGGEPEKLPLTEESLDTAALLMSMAFSRPHLTAPGAALAVNSPGTAPAPAPEAMDVDDDLFARDTKPSGPGARGPWQNSREPVSLSDAGPLRSSSALPRRPEPNHLPPHSSARAPTPTSKPAAPSLPPRPLQAGLPPQTAAPSPSPAQAPRTSMPGAVLPTKPNIATPRQSVPPPPGHASLPAKPISVSRRARPSPVSINPSSIPIIPSISPVPATPYSVGGPKVHPPPWPGTSAQQAARPAIPIVPQPSSAPSTPVAGMPAGRASNSNGQAATKREREWEWKRGHEAQGHIEGSRGWERVE